MRTHREDEREPTSKSGVNAENATEQEEYGKHQILAVRAR
jgi:hypothetical protein